VFTTILVQLLRAGLYTIKAKFAPVVKIYI